MFMELLSVAILGGKYVNEKIEQNKPYKHVMNTPREIESRKRAEEIYDCSIVNRVDTIFNENYLRTVA